MSKNIPVGTYMPPKLKAQVEKAAKEDSRTFSATLSLLVEDGLAARREKVKESQSAQG